MRARWMVGSMMLLAGSAASMARVATGTELLPPDEAFKIVQAVRRGSNVDIDYYPAPGYYLYADKFSFDIDRADVKVAAVTLPPGERRHEAVLDKDVVLYRHPVRLRLRISGAGGRYRLVAHGQGCAEVGVCYPPFARTFELQAEE